MEKDIRVYYLDSKKLLVSVQEEDKGCIFYESSLTMDKNNKVHLDNLKPVNDIFDFIERGNYTPKEIDFSKKRL